MGKVRDYKDGIVSGKFKGLAGLLKMKGVEVIPGEGKLTAQDTITVGGVEYKAQEHYPGIRLGLQDLWSAH